MGSRLGLEAADPGGRRQRRGAHLAGARLGLADLGVAVAAAAFAGAQVEAAGHARVARVTVLGAARGAFLRARSGSGPPAGRGGRGEVGELREEEPGSTAVEGAGWTGWGWGWGGTRAHLAGRTAVPRRAGTLLHLQRRVLAGVLGHGHVHADAGDPGGGKDPGVNEHSRWTVRNPWGPTPDHLVNLPSSLAAMLRGPRPALSAWASSPQQPQGL